MKLGTGWMELKSRAELVSMQQTWRNNDLFYLGNQYKISESIILKLY